MKRITKEQKKIIYISGIVILALILFWALVHAPQKRRLAAIKSDLQRAEAQIAEISTLMQGRELTEAVQELNLKFKESARLLTPEDEDVIAYLSEEARDLEIEVKDITPSGRQSLQKQVAGFDIEELAISMNLVCEFKELGEYLNTLRDNFPVLIEVRELKVQGEGEGRPALDISLKISAYLAK